MTPEAQASPHLAPKVTLDWLACTFPDGSVDALSLASWLGGEWEVMPRGLHGYRTRRACGGLSILSDGSEGMGVHLIISGEGCREVPGRSAWASWPEFLAALLDLGASFTRVDLAIDDRTGLLDLAVIEAALQAGHVATHARKWKPEEEYDLGTGEGGGRTLYVGRRVSHTFVRFYDKAREQQGKGKEPPEGCDSWAGVHWVRCELETKAERAQFLAEGVARLGIAWAVQVLAAAIEFKLPGENALRSRWAPAPWWEAFLGSLRKARMIWEAVAPSLADLQNWLSHQVAPSLATFWLAAGGDYEALARLCDSGRSRLKPKHRAMLAAVT